jgi:hypothetical protein
MDVYHLIGLVPDLDDPKDLFGRLRVKYAESANCRVRARSARRGPTPP